MKRFFDLIVPLKKEDAIRVEHRQYSKVVHPIYVFKCKNLECPNELFVNSGGLKNRTGFCQSCVAKKIRPKMTQRTQLRKYEALFNKFARKALAANKGNLLCYEDFLKFVEINSCHYCDFQIDWNSKSAYNLDRKDTLKPYSVDNCVVCCPLCNFTKRDEFSYEEFLIIGRSIKQIRENRR